jgi:Ca2+-binding RTX toxin-like protein
MLILTAAVLTLGVPGVAHAGTVSVVGGTPVESGTATFRAAAGEINDVTVHDTHPFEHMFDDVAFMIAGRGCTSTGFTSASCIATRGVSVDLRDLDDHGHVVVGSGNAELRGGSGNDTLDADSTTQGTQVYGQGGDDDVSAGGEGGQVADGGAGDDTVRCCGFAGGGTALGGSGDDLLRYATALGGSISIDAGTGDDSVAAQPAGNASSATATGGTGDDIIVIDGNPPSSGTPHGYAVSGDDGDDTLVGGPQADTIDAGAGRDFVDVRGGGADTVTCGAGRDIVRHDATDTIDADCEIQLAG